MIKYYSMFYVDKNTNANNLKSDNIKEIYIKNIISLNRSILLKGGTYTILTNDPELENEIKKYQYNVKCEVIKFTSDIPPGIRFYNAHYKKDVFKYFSSLKQVSCLIDIDVICINNISNYHYEGVPIVYDISYQINGAYGKNTIDADINLILNENEKNNLWFGGEFIVGDNLFYRKLYSKIEKIYPTYKKNVNNLKHIGDEAFTSAAINLLLREGMQIDIQKKWVQRYWNDIVKHNQNKLTRNSLFLHLPADKKYLAKIYNSELKIKYFYIFYIIHIYSIKNCLRLLIKKIIWN